MSQSVSVAAALGAAGSAAVAAALQARSARHQHPQGAVQGAVHGLSGFAREQLGRKVWWAALAVQAFGFALHGVALSAGALTLVQPLMASAIVLALPLNHYLNGSAVTHRELVWAGLLAVGLSGFLVTSAASQPLPGSTSQGTTTAAAVAVVLIAGCVALAGRSGSRGAAALLGTGAATAFAAEAALLQNVAGLALTNPSRLLTSPALYGLMVAGFLGVALTQLAYRAGPMSAALPAIVTVNPLLSIGYGIVVLGETFRHTAGAVVTEMACFGLLCVGAVALTRHAQPDSSPLPLKAG